MRPRFVTSAVTLLVLVVIVGGAGYWGWKHVTAPAPGLLPSNVCQTKTRRGHPAGEPGDGQRLQRRHARPGWRTTS